MELFALLGVILTVVGSIVTNQMNIKNSNEQLQNQQNFSHNEAELANQRAVENYWETMSPQSKVEQYKEAGLSPGLMYGGSGTGGGVTVTSQAQTPGANLPIMQNPFGNGINDLFENLKKLKETEKTEEETVKTKEETNKIKSEIEVNNAEIEKIAKENGLTEVLTQNSKLDNILKQVEVEIAESTKENKIKIVATQLENLKKEGEKLLEEIKGLKIDNENKQKIYDATIKKMAAETMLLYKQSAKTEAETLLAKSQNVLLNEQVQLTFAERQKCYKETKQLETLMAKIEAETKLIEQQTGKIKLEKVSEIIGWINEAAQVSDKIAGTILKASFLPK